LNMSHEKEFADLIEKLLRTIWRLKAICSLGSQEED